MGDELVKSAIRIVGLGVAAFAIYALIPSVGIDKVIVTALAVVTGTAVAILWSS